MSLMHSEVTVSEEEIRKSLLSLYNSENRPALVLFMHRVKGNQVAYPPEIYRTLKEHKILEDGGLIPPLVYLTAKRMFDVQEENLILKEA